MMKRSVLAVLALAFFVVAACQPAEEPAGEMQMEEAPATEQMPATPADTGMMGDTAGGMMQDTMM